MNTNLCSYSVPDSMSHDCLTQLWLQNSKILPNVHFSGLPVTGVSMQDTQFWVIRNKKFGSASERQFLFSLEIKEVAIPSSSWLLHLLPDECRCPTYLSDNHQTTMRLQVSARKLLGSGSFTE